MNEARTRKIRFPGGSGEMLAGVLHRPSHVIGSFVLSHCFTCSKNYKVLVRLGRYLSEAGFAVLRFDFAGLGESEGDFERTTLRSDVSDIQAAVDWMRSEELGWPILAGHSMGGAASVLAAERIAQVPAAAVIATASDTANLMRLLPDLSPRERPSQGSIEVTIGGQQYPLSQEFLSDIQDYSLPDSVAALERPFLVLHGTRDTTVPIHHGEKLFAAAQQPKSFFALPEAEHLLSRPQDSDSAGAVLAAWAARIFAG